MVSAVERECNRRNLNPHKAALIAMTIWAAEYAKQGGGSMEFWDKLSEGRKQTCRELLERLEKAESEVL